jgi:hypothetical protein
MQPQSYNGYNNNTDNFLSMSNNESSLSQVNQLKAIRHDTTGTFYKDDKNISSDAFIPKSLNLSELISDRNIGNPIVHQSNPIDYQFNSIERQANPIERESNQEQQYQGPLASGYQSTGNNVPLKPDELENVFNHVLNLLKQYDITNSGTNPYSEKLIYTTTDGKVIQIPPTIQDKAIQLHQDDNQQ